MANQELESAIEELNRSHSLPVYEGFDVAWLAVLKIANLLPGVTEGVRMAELLNRLSEDSARHIVKSKEIDTLINPEPPLESILSSPHERLNRDGTRQELESVRLHRNDDPKLALEKLAAVLKRIRNRRSHGFKSPTGPRDVEILGAGLLLLRLVGLSAAEAMGAK